MLDYKSLRIRAEKEIEESADLKELNDVFNKYLGKKGEITRILRSLKDFSDKEKKNIGQEVNRIKSILEEKFSNKRSSLAGKETNEGWIDISVPAKRFDEGHFHPLTLVKRDIEAIFQAMGFRVVGGPEIESEWYNFDALNIPKDHPARDLWDTFYLKEGSLLRTHTSPVQIRFMEKNNPPFRIIAPGRVYRHEATDASHEFDLYQVEGLMVGKDVSVANFKAIIAEFLSRFFGRRLETRLRPSYFPFVEPGFELDIRCVICEGKGCSVCKNTGWLETIPGGMVHPSVLKSGGIDPRNWQGFAFGAGMDRLAMLKYKINDIRLLRSGDLRFLNQF